MGDVIRGHAYGQLATLEICGDSLTWRARPDGELPENIATTVHDVRKSRWIEDRISLPGLALVVAGGAWMYSYGIVVGAIAIAAGIGVFAWRRTKPRRLLVLDLGSRRLVMTVEAASAAFARTLVKRINQAIESGEVPSSPPSLP